MKTSEITLLLRCHHLPATDGLRLGIQKRQEVIEDIPSATPEVTFAVPISVKSSIQQGGTPEAENMAALDFAGPFVQGKVGERFIYLCWGTRQGEHWQTALRAKFPLRYLSEKQVSDALETGQPFRVSIDMTDAKGKPVCATIRSENLT
jgi:hypothetical protein